MAPVRNQTDREVMKKLSHTEKERDAEDRWSSLESCLQRSKGLYIAKTRIVDLC